MARMLGLKLGDAVNIQENGGASLAYSFNAQNIAGRESTSSILGPIAPGQISVTPSVIVRYELQK